MKRKFIALAMAGMLIGAISFAQIPKGSLLIGGSAGFGSYKENAIRSQPYYSNSTIKHRSHSVSPSFGMAVKDNLIIGADITYEEQTQKVNYTYPYMGPVVLPYFQNKKYKNYSKGGGVFVRQYWGIARNFYVFGQGRLGFAITRNEYGQATNPSATFLKGWNVNASVYPGLSYAISKKVHLESTFFNLLTLQYQNQNNTSDPEVGVAAPYKRTQFSVSSSFDNATAFSLGVRVLLSK